MVFQLKYYYDRYHCRHFAPFLLLLSYSLLGAWMFYIVEHDNEKILKRWWKFDSLLIFFDFRKEMTNLENLRNGLVNEMATHLKGNDFSKAM